MCGGGRADGACRVWPLQYTFTVSSKSCRSFFLQCSELMNHLILFGMSLELGRLLNVELDTVVAAQLIRLVQACDDCLTNN